MKQTTKQKRIQQRNLERATYKNLVLHIITILIIIFVVLHI